MQIKISSNDSAKLMAFLMPLSKVFPEHTNDMLQLMRSAPNGVTVEILPTKVEQTDEQRGYYRQQVKNFADWCGMIPDAMHEEILCECFGSDTLSTPFGWRRIPHKRSGNVNRADYSALIETLIRVAAEMGYVVPPPMRKLPKGENSEQNQRTD